MNVTVPSAAVNPDAVIVNLSDPMQLDTPDTDSSVLTSTGLPAGEESVVTDTVEALNAAQSGQSHSMVAGATTDESLACKRTVNKVAAPAYANVGATLNTEKPEKKLKLTPDTTRPSGNLLLVTVRVTAESPATDADGDVTSTQATPALRLPCELCFSTCEALTGADAPNWNCKLDADSE